MNKCLKYEFMKSSKVPKDKKLFRLLYVDDKTIDKIKKIKPISGNSSQGEGR